MVLNKPFCGLAYKIDGSVAVYALTKSVLYSHHTSHHMLNNSLVSFRINRTPTNLKTTIFEYFVIEFLITGTRTWLSSKLIIISIIFLMLYFVRKKCRHQIPYLERFSSNFLGLTSCVHFQIVWMCHNLERRKWIRKNTR